MAVQLGLDDLGMPLVGATFTVVDLETTGLSARDDRITEVGAVRARGGEVIGELRTFVHPGGPIPPAITALTGITDADVADAPRIEAVLPTVLRFLDGSVFVAHNARFDLGFLRAAAERLGLGPFDPPIVDTAVLARRLVRDEVRDVRLATLAAHFRSPIDPDHRALSDARATLHVLHALIERASAFGVVTVEDLLEVSRSRSDRSHRRIGLVEDAPSAPGVYRFLDAKDTVLYIGTTKDLRRRLRSYFGQDPRRRIGDMVAATERVTWTVTPTAIEASVTEVREIHEHRPRYNHRSTRPAATVAVALTRDTFPRLSIVREHAGDHRRILGPVASRAVAEAAVEALLEVHPVRECTQRLRRRQDHAACVLKDLGRCGAPCDGTQSIDDYEATIVAFEAALDDPEATIVALRDRMVARAEAGDFERAGLLRERVHALVRVLDATRRWSMLTRVERLVAARTHGDTTEAIDIAHGRLVASAVTRAEATDAGILDALDARDGHSVMDGPRREDAEEVALIASWLVDPATRIVRVTGELASALAGGRAIARELDDSRRVERLVRNDADLLAGRKVRRRDTTEPRPGASEPQTISNHGENASGSITRDPTSRPSQVARTR